MSSAPPAEFPNLETPPSPGRVLGDFVLMEKLEVGGFGTVFRAEQRLLGREAVVKILHRSNAEASTQRFLREARLASKLDHPFAAHIYAFGAELDGLLWIAMERVRGSTLQQLIRTQGPLPLHRFVPFFEKLCEVVHTAHSQNIVHRDLKPTNVMVLSRAGKLLPKLLDMGIAKLLDDETEPSTDSGAGVEHSGITAMEEKVDSLGATDVAGELTGSHFSRTQAALDRAVSLSLTQAEGVMGTPHYMAPEQWVNAARATARTDIYALGFVAYECLTGKPPFTGNSVREIATAHAKRFLPPLPSTFPSELDAVLAKATAKRPADRYATTMEFALALRAASHLTEEQSLVPQLPDEIRDLFIGDAPQPLAESMALLEAARRPERALLAGQDLLRVIARYVGMLTLAARARVGPGGSADEPQTVEAFKRLHADSLDDLDWWELAKGLVAPFRECADAYPLPELVTFLCDPERAAVLPELWRQLEELKKDPNIEPDLGPWIGNLGRFLNRLTFLHEYSLRLRRGTAAEVWMGLRRTARTSAELGPDPVPDGTLYLAHLDGTMALSLSPFMQAIAPSPGVPLEPFVLSGTGRHGAKLVALPVPFERYDEGLWSWFSEHVVPVGLDAEQEAQREITPYRGLAAFTADEAENFFGREREAEAFANRLRIQTLLGIVGPSGAGKSSFIQAGVLPLLRDWRVTTVRPGPSPLAALTQRLAQEHMLPEGLSTQDARKSLGEDPSLLGVWLGDAAQRHRGGLLLVADQFEELVTLCADPDEREKYARALVDAATSPEKGVRIVLSFRDDFLIRLQQLPPLRERLGQSLQLLGTPAPDDLLRILIKPAERARYAFEDDELPRQMVKEVESLPGALAMLSFTASKLWELRDRQLKRLRRKAYIALGGVGGALAHHAEATLTAMPERDQPLVREAFRHLVTAEGTRAILTRKELDELLGGPAQSQPLLERLIVARLLVTSEGAGLEDRVEVIHEALLVSWPRLVQWQREDAENLRIRDALRAAARQWVERGRPRGLLWRREPLGEYKTWRARYSGAITEIEGAFAAASLREETRGRNLRRGLLVGGFTILLVVLAVVSRAQRQAVHSAEQARSRLAELRLQQGRLSSLEGKSLEALAYLDAAGKEGVAGPEIQYLIGRSRAATEGTELSVLAHDGPANTLALSPDETLMVTGSTDRMVAVWSTANGRRVALLRGHVSAIHLARFSPDGKTLLTGAQDGAVRLWNVADWSARGSLENPEGAVWDFDVSPDGTLVAVTTTGNIVNVWDLRTQKRVRRLEATTRTTQARFSPDGRLLAACLGPYWNGMTDPGVVTLWNVSKQWEQTVLKAHERPVRYVAFSPDSATMATGSDDSTIRLWDLKRRQQTAHFSGHTDSVLVLSFSREGRLLVSGAADGTARVWDLAAKKRLANLASNTGSIFHAEFTADGKRVVTAGEDPTVRLWDARSGSLLWAFIGHVKPVRALTQTRDGRHLLTAAAEGFVKIWSLDRERFTRLPLEKPVFYFELSQDGHRMLVNPFGDSVLEEWDIQTRARRFSGKTPTKVAFFSWSAQANTVAVTDGDQAQVLRLPGMEELLKVPSLAPESPGDTLIALEPNGEHVAIGHRASPKLELWNVAQRRRVATLVANGQRNGILYFSSGPLGLLSGAVDGTVTSWRPSDGARQRTFKTSRDSVLRALTASQDARFVATATDDHGVVVWDTRNGNQFSLDGQQGPVEALTFSADASLLAAVGGAPHVSVWETGRWENVTDLHTDLPLGQAVLSPTGRLFTSEWAGRILEWDLSAPPLSQDDLSQLVRCQVPYQLAGERLTVHLKPEGTCPPVQLLENPTSSRR